MKLKKCLLTLFSLGLSTVGFSASWETLVEQRPDVQAYIQYMATRYHYDPIKLTDMFNTIKTASAAEIALNARPAIKQMNWKHDFIKWCQYRKIFITEDEIQGGADYWHKNKSWLSKAQDTYGVPPEIIVATIGVETKYAKNMGTFPVFQTIAVLAFDYKRRQPYFLKELTAFLLYCQANEIDPLSIRGSYAGAIGQPQFMPSNIARYAVDFDQKGSIDLVSDDADAIGSVAHYYQMNHWKTGQTVACQANITDSKINSLSNFDQKKTVFLDFLAQGGVYCPGFVIEHKPVKVISLDNCDGPEYWLTFDNFKVLKSYNSSTDYAMALFQLSTEIKARYEKQYAKKQIQGGSQHTE